MHPEKSSLEGIAIPNYTKIAVALDFRDNDAKLIAAALGQANRKTSFILIHIVESATARFLGSQTDDYETKADKERLDHYAHELKLRGFSAETKLGFKTRSKEIVRLVNESHADLLIVGAHGHTGFKDLIFGETVNSVRHELLIPVLVINIR